MFEYSPTVRSHVGPYRGAALVGTHTVSIGWSFDDEALRDGLHGFAIRHSEFDHSGEMIEIRWLGGFKRFAEADDGDVNDVTSLIAPFQRFRWNEYTLRPDRGYRYEVFPMRGAPTALTRDEDPLVFEFAHTPEDDGALGVYVNRGVTAAKAYFRRFGDVHPKDILPEGSAYAWLSRGLKESLLGFIRETQSGEALHVSIYEFFDHEVVGALKEALDRGVDVSLVHDAKEGKNSTAENLHVIHKFGLENITIKIHAKMIVVDLFGDNPRVLIGSANFSKPSCKDNDENAVLIEGDKRLAAILATEFMRMYDHYKSRWWIEELHDQNLPPNFHLKSDGSWSGTAFNENSNSHKLRDRITFAG